jgi:hypothetical protein
MNSANRLYAKKNTVKEVKDTEVLINRLIYKIHRSEFNIDRV